MLSGFCRHRPTRVAVLGLSAACVALTLPAYSHAAVTVGQTFVPNVGNTCNGSPAFEVLMTDVASGNSYTVPSSGVLTSWSFETGTQDTQTTLRVYRPTGTAHRYTAVTGNPLQTFLANSGLHTVPTRNPVNAGDIIGHDSRTGECSMFGTSADTFEFYTGSPHAQGTTNTYTSNSGYRDEISAQLEPDADHDGFGDETQDACPAKATKQGACILSGPSISGKTEVGKTLTATSTAQGGTPSYHWLRGSGNTFTPIPGATGSTYNLVKSDRGKRIKVAESVTSPKGSDSATSTPTAAVGPPLIRSSAKKTQRVVLQRGVVVKLRSNLAATLTATGTIGLPKGTAKVVRFKRTKRSLKAGKLTKVTLRLSAKNVTTLRRALRPPHKLKARLVLTLKDKLGGKTTKKLTITVKR